MQGLVYHVTDAQSLDSIAEYGLIPLLGVRAKRLGELAPAVYLFKTREQAEDAIVNWLGDEPEGSGIGLVEIDASRIPGTLEAKSGQFELVSYEAIPACAVLDTEVIEPSTHQTHYQLGMVQDDAGARVLVARDTDIGFAQDIQFAYQNHPESWTAVAILAPGKSLAHALQETLMPLAFKHVLQRMIRDHGGDAWDGLQSDGDQMSLVGQGASVVLANDYEATLSFEAQCVASLQAPARNHSLERARG